MPTYRMTVQKTVRGYVYQKGDDAEQAKATATTFQVPFAAPGETIDYQIVDEPRLVEAPTVGESDGG